VTGEAGKILSFRVLLQCRNKTPQNRKTEATLTSDKKPVNSWLTGRNRISS
jgi:hypothetical protein